MAKKPKTPEYPTRDTVIELGKRLCAAADEYADRKGYTEKHFELALFCLLQGRKYSRVATQRKAKLKPKKGAKKPNQIDFEIGKTNRVALEFAVRRMVYLTKTKKWQAKGHTVSENRSELRKLTHEDVAKVRYLLIVDVSGQPHVDLHKLKKDYQTYVDSPPFKRKKSVTVVYVHSGADTVIEC